MAKTVLIDSCIWFDYIEKDEPTVNFVHQFRHEKATVILPFPCLYEVVNTRLTKHKPKLFAFEKLLQNLQLAYFDDQPYREEARTEVFNKARWGFSYSLVDCVLREMIKDKNVKINYLATLNFGDFADVCALRNIEIIKP